MNCSTDNRFYCENKEPLFVHKHQVSFHRETIHSSSFYWAHQGWICCRVARWKTLQKSKQYK